MFWTASVRHVVQQITGLNSVKKNISHTDRSDGPLIKTRLFLGQKGPIIKNVCSEFGELFYDSFLYLRHHQFSTTNRDVRLRRVWAKIIRRRLNNDRQLEIVAKPAETRISKTASESVRIPTASLRYWGYGELNRIAGVVAVVAGKTGEYFSCQKFLPKCKISDRIPCCGRIWGQNENFESHPIDIVSRHSVQWPQESRIARAQKPSQITHL